MCLVKIGMIHFDQPSVLGTKNQAASNFLDFNEKGN
jgi:hypothetical protein